MRSRGGAIVGLAVGLLIPWAVVLGVSALVLLVYDSSGGTESVIGVAAKAVAIVLGFVMLFGLIPATVITGWKALQILLLGADKVEL